MKSKGHASENMASIVHMAKMLAINSDTYDDIRSGEESDGESQAQIEER